MQWWLDAKFGLFIHWGLYSVLAGEYKGRKTNNIAEWIMHDFQIPPTEYAQIAEQFDPKEFGWAFIIHRLRIGTMKTATNRMRIMRRRTSVNI